MVDIAAISGLATVLTTARRLLRDLKEKNLSSQHAALVDQAMEVVTDANERLFAIQSTPPGSAAGEQLAEVTACHGKGLDRSPCEL